jgi:hypothetical protein
VLTSGCVHVHDHAVSEKIQGFFGEGFFFLLRLGVPQAILLIMATLSCGF